MADPFDSSALFAEFNRPRQASDRILMSNLKDNNQKNDSGRADFGFSARKGAKTNKEAPSSPTTSSSDGSSSSDDESETETADRDDGPVEIGRDEAGCILYRPGERERRVGMRLLQNADYEDVNDQSQVGDNGADINKNEIEKLRVTNTMYRKQTRLIDPTRHIPADEHTDSPALQVLFMNHDFARKYRADIERFISDLIYKDMMDQPMRPVRQRPHHVCLAEGTAEVKDQDQAYHEHRTSTVIGASRFYMDFVVDNMGFPLVDYIPALSDGWEIPRYEQQFRKVLPAESDSDDEDKPPPQKQGSMCFNCGGDHRLNDCQEQRDFQRIAANRNKFQANNKMMQGTLNKGITNTSSKFGAFKPGVYSKALLEALGVQPNRLPFFVYRMRQLGYPPGYLMEAEVERSGISMFDKDGQVLKSKSDQHESGSLEDGEMNEETDDDKVVYNVDKIIDFPGFNVPLPENVSDEGHRYGCPPMQPTQSKEYMQNNLPTPRGLKRQSTRKEDHGGKRRRLVEDMDLDESEMEQTYSDQGNEESIIEVAPPLVWWQHYYQSAPIQQDSYTMTPPLPAGEAQYVGPHYDVNLLPPPLPPESPPRSPTTPPPPPPPDSPPNPLTPPSGSCESETIRMSSISVTVSTNSFSLSPENAQYLGPITSEGDHSPDSPVEWTDDQREACEEGTPRSIPLDRLLPCVAEGTEPGVSRSSSCGSFSRSDTPTLEDLEAQQRLLRQELGEEDSQDSSQRSSRASSVDNTENHKFTVPEPPGTPGGNPPLPNAPPPQTPPAPPLPPGTPPVTPNTSFSGPLSSTPGDSFTTPVNSQSANSSLNRSNSASIERKLSTPVRRKCTEDLPDATQFRVGVQDHIPFENLPDAVGTYDKMKDVISQIRRLKKKSQ